MALLGSCDVRLGGQGWSEPDWRAVFYPPGLKPAERLASYASAFDFVEIDSTFYAAPAPPVVEAWRERTPADFRFAAKVPRAITHDPDPSTGRPRRPLEGEGWPEQLAGFAESMRLLENKLLALLVQLPPQWHWQPARLGVLERFLEALPADLPWAIEFRHRGWLNDAVFDLLRHRRVAFTIQDLYYMPRHVEVTTPELAYIRLQGRRKDVTTMSAVQIERDEALDFWADVVRAVARRWARTVIVAVNNHYQGFSPGTVAALQRRLGLPVSIPPAQQGRQLPLA
jgi:uncharacterized protein YecE (DUF72 family)